MPKVLILCTGNSCRSQMAEALFRHRSHGHWECRSAGIQPAGRVHPLALETLAERGIPVENLRSKHVDEFKGDHFDLALTVCDDAKESCPIFFGASERRHWSFEDPAASAGTDDERRAVFWRAFDEIDAAVCGYLRTPSEHFRIWMEQALLQWPGGCPAELAPSYRMLAEKTVTLLGDGRLVWARIPALVLELFHARGWEWNGIYLRRGDRLVLGPAAGPPVCAELRMKGGVGTSGMCSDAILTNQTLVAADVSRWPGYVRCNAESGLVTVAALVCPIRDAGGTPIAVWDLDATRPIESADAVFFDRYFASLSSLLKPTAEEISGATSGRTAGEHEQGPSIKLDQFLKLQGIVETGGRAKLMVQAGDVKVNGTVERRRGRRLRPGDTVSVLGVDHSVNLDTET